MSISNHKQQITSLLINGTELSSTLAALSARQDTLTAALANEDTSDYNGEIIDARADSFGNTHSLIGNNIRQNQAYLFSFFNEKINLLQSQIDSLANAYATLATVVDKIISERS